MKALALFMAALVGGFNDGVWAYFDAIVATTDDATERAVLAVVAKHETWFHLASRTPPFGLTERESRGLPRLSLADSARVSLALLHHARRQCEARGARGWAPALGRYHHGTTGPRAGCWADALAAREWREASAAVTAMRAAE